MKGKRASVLIMMILISHLHNIDSRILQSSDIKNLDSFFDNNEIESAIKKESKTKSLLKKSHHNWNSSMKLYLKSPQERNLKQTKNTSSFNLEFKNISSKKKNLKIKKKKMNLSSFNNENNSQVKKLLEEKMLSKMVRDIKKNASKNKLRIKRVLLGDEVKQKFNDKNLTMHFSKLLNMPNLNKHMKSVNRRLKKLRRKMKKNQIKKQKDLKKAQNIAPSPTPSPEQVNRNLAGAPKAGASTGGKGGEGDNLMKFNFLPGFAGMPFPPFMMNGPHFHPPLNVTVNSLPNPNPRAELDPKEIEEENVKSQLKSLQPINDKLDHVLREIDSISKESTINLEDKYQRVLQLNN
jgi:hypothetical protein